MVTVKECATFARLASNEMVLGATPSATHRVLLSSYLLNLWRGPKTVRKMIVADIRMWLDLGMPKHASDLLIVLRQFLSDYPESRFEQESCDSPVRNFHSTVPGAAQRINHTKLMPRLARTARVSRSLTWRSKMATVVDKRP